MNLTKTLLQLPIYGHQIHSILTIRQPLVALDYMLAYLRH